MSENAKPVKPIKPVKGRRVSFRMEDSKVRYLLETYHTDSISVLFNRLVDERIAQNFNFNVDKPPISAIGGKQSIADKIVGMFPKHKIYVEPFANTAAVLLRKPPSQLEVYNDADKEVSNFYRVLKEQPIALYNACMSLPYSEQLFREFKGFETPVSFGSKDLLTSNDPIDRAAIFFFMSHTGRFGGRSGGFVRPDRSSEAKGYLKDVERIIAVSKRLSAVDILCGDYKKIINKYGAYEDSFFFVDPPYLDTDFYYGEPFGVDEHRRLANKLLEMRGKFLFCHYSDKRINKYYKECCCRDIYVTVASQKPIPDSDGVLRKPRKVLKFYANYDIDEVVATQP